MKRVYQAVQMDLDGVETCCYEGSLARATVEAALVSNRQGVRHVKVYFLGKTITRKATYRDGLTTEQRVVFNATGWPTTIAEVVLFLRCQPSTARFNVGDPYNCPIASCARARGVQEPKVNTAEFHDRDGLAARCPAQLADLQFAWFDLPNIVASPRQLLHVARVVQTRYDRK